jgi:hypothetical protein
MPAATGMQSSASELPASPNPVRPGPWTTLTTAPSARDTYGGTHPLELLAFDMVGAQQTHDDRCQGSDGRDYEEHDADVTE